LNNLSPFKIGENKFGKVEYTGLTEVEITSSEHFVELKNNAAANRSTSTTFKNDTSSRSHSICRILLEDTAIKSMEKGELYFIDLAGSESLADSQFHDKS